MFSRRAPRAVSHEKVELRPGQDKRQRAASWAGAAAAGSWAGAAAADPSARGSQSLPSLPGASPSAERTHTVKDP